MWKVRFLWLPALAAIVSVGAGLYLIGTQSAASNSIFNPLLHGIGAYFVARGLFMGWSASREVENASRLADQVDMLRDRERLGQCPFCLEDMHLEAEVCPHCQREVSPATAES
jgi:hypothetical protein